MGKPRFAGLMEMIPSELTVMGIDEKTALLIEPEACTCRVIGLGGVTLIHTGPAHRSAANSESLNGTGLDEVAQNRQAHVHQYRNGQLFSLQRIGPFEYPDTGSGLPDEVWRQAIEARHRRGKAAEESPSEDSPPAEVLSLVNERQAARVRKDWRESDRLRDQVLAFGWQIQDTPEGPRVVRNE
jgi:hypothetical protein